MIMTSTKKYEVCPNCFGENVIPRSWQGSDEWICKDCNNTFPSALKFSKKDKSKIQKKHLIQMKKINKTEKRIVKSTKFDKNNLLRIIVLLVIIVFILMIIYTIILGFK